MHAVYDVGCSRFVLTFTNNALYVLCRFVFFLTLVTLSIVNLALIGRITRQTRSMMVGYMAVNLALAIYSTNRIYDLSHFSGHGKYYHSARAVFTGFIFLDIGFFGLIYLLGLEF